MPIKMPATDEGKLNMTPMIDIVFNLVTFFMLTLDLSRKELAALDLPRANKGVEDKDPGANATLEIAKGKSKEEARSDNTRFVINLLANGNIMLKGDEYPLSAASPAEQQKSLNLLRDKLKELTRNPALREKDGSSKVMVLVRGDRTTKWKYVQWVMQICAEQKIYKIHFGVEGPPKE
ncbi:MAG: biopolymer transporter ExbD [Planctomycetota bacterium]